MKKLAVIAVVLIGLVAAASAGAANEQPPPPGFQVTEPAHLPMVETLEPIAWDYWALRRVTLPEPVEVFLMPDSPVDSAWGEQPGRRIWITESRLSIRGYGGRVGLCMTYLHERGHNAGLSHDSGDPIMGDAWGVPFGSPPPKCVKWAKGGYREALRARARLIAISSLAS